MEQKTGPVVDGWAPCPSPNDQVLTGQYAALEPLDADRHAAELFRAYSADPDGSLWTYIPYGPFSSAATFHHWARDTAAKDDPFCYAIRDLSSGHVCGVASLMRIKPEAGSIEVGGITYAPELQRTPAATEAMFLLMQWAFKAGYRRYEWKCDALNIPSRRAAERLGFSYEGVFRQALVVKGRNRDTAWFACIDKEWPALQEAYRAWLAPSNFDRNGRQIERLGDMTNLVRVSQDPVIKALSSG